MEDSPADNNIRVSLKATTIFTHHRAIPGGPPNVGGLRTGFTPLQARKAILSRHTDLDIRFFDSDPESQNNMPLMVAARPGELLTASFTPPPSKPRATIIGRALLYQLGPTLNLEEATRFDVIDNVLEYVRSEIRFARTRFRYPDARRACQALEAPPCFPRSPGTDILPPPADLLCRMRDHLEIVERADTMRNIDQLLEDPDIRYRAGMHHHLWLATIRRDFVSDLQRAPATDCVLL